MKLATTLSTAIGAFAAFLLAAAPGVAQTSTDRPGSIVVFPKVVYSATSDTLIQITNTGNSVNAAHCMYIGGTPGLPSQGPCVENDFDIVLTRQQPTMWRAGTGRLVSYDDAFGTYGNGYDPGRIPPLPSGFTGSLLCYEMMWDGSLSPLAQNRLKGEATIQSSLNGDVNKYNAVAIPALQPDLDKVLSLDDSEYGVCPSALLFNFLAAGGPDPGIEAYGAGGGLSQASMNLTLLPCSLDFENGLQPAGTVDLVVRDEFETSYSSSFGVGCWTSFDISTLAPFRSLLRGGVLSTLYATARLTPAGVPVLAVAESSHTDANGVTATASVNVHDEIGNVAATIVIP